MKKILVLGAGGFIGTNLVNNLLEQGHDVLGVDIVLPSYPYKKTARKSARFRKLDLRNRASFKSIFDAETKNFDEIYQLAADMGGAGYIFSGDHDADVMTNSGLINLNLIQTLMDRRYKTKIFYSSSACIYPERNQLDPKKPNCAESSAYPAAPDSEYGWEKLFSERAWMSYARANGNPVKIARFHNIFGEYGTYEGGKEKAPAAVCRKVIQVKPGNSIELWGDGKQTRSFLYIEDCLAGVEILMKHKTFHGPVNIGSEEMVTINRLAEMAIEISGKKNIKIKHIPGPLGVRGRNSDNRLIRKELNWAPSLKLEFGLRRTYDWIAGQIEKK